MQTISNAFGGANGGPVTLSTSTAVFGQNAAGSTPGNNSNSYPQVGGTGSTIKIFAQTGLGGASAFVLPVPGAGKLEGQQYTVRAGGWVYVAGSSPTLQISLQSGTSLTGTSNTNIASLAATAATLTTANYYPWALTADFQGDSVSGVTQGTAQLKLNNVFTSSAAITSLTGSKYIANDPVFSFVTGATFGVSNSANVAQLNQFSLEA
jgi:hypothetical protein